MTDRPTGLLAAVWWYARLTAELAHSAWHEIRWWRTR